MIIRKHFVHITNVTTRKVKICLYTCKDEPKYYVVY